jgi:hypothetical protein
VETVCHAGEPNHRIGNYTRIPKIAPKSRLNRCKPSGAETCAALMQEHTQALLEHGHPGIHEGRNSHFVEPFAGLLRMQYDGSHVECKSTLRGHGRPIGPNAIRWCCIGRRAGNEEASVLLVTAVSFGMRSV